MKNQMRPLNVRRAALKGYSDGRSLRDLAAECKVSPQAVRKWATQAGVKKNQPLTDEELDEIIEAWGDSHRKLEIQGEATERKKAFKEKKLRQKFGLSKEDKEKSVASFRELGSVDEYKTKIKEQYELNMETMSGALSPQAQAEVLMRGLLLTQLHELVGNLPPVTNWADLERFSKMTRSWLNMDKDDAGEGVGADLKILNAKVEKDKVIEVDPETGKPVKPKRGRKNAS